MGTSSQNVTIDFSLKFDDALVKPKSPTYSWSPVDHSSSVKVLADTRTIPASASATAVVLPSHADALFHVIEEVDRADKLTVFINGDANGNILRPWRVVSGAITALTVSNSDTTNVQYLRIYTVIPEGTVFERSGTITTPSDLLFALIQGVTDGYQLYVSSNSITTLPANGKVLYNATAKTTDYTQVTSDATVRFNVSSNANYDLLTAAAMIGRRFVVKNLYTSTSTVTINPDSAELIEGSSFYRLSNPGEVAVIYSNGTSWEIESSWQGL